MDIENLLSELESTELPHFSEKIVTHLKPLLDGKEFEQQTYHFLSKCQDITLDRIQHIINDRISQSPSNFDLIELSKVSSLCLDCFDILTLVKRLEVLHFKMHNMLYKDAETAAFFILDRIRPIMSNNTFDHEKYQAFRKILEETIAGLVQCAAKTKTKERHFYHEVVKWINEAEEWLKQLNVSDAQMRTFYENVINPLKDITIFLVEELIFSDEDLIVDFYKKRIAMLSKSNMMDSICEFAGEICILLLEKSDKKEHEKSVSYILGQVFKQASKFQIDKEHFLKSTFKVVEHINSKYKEIFAETNTVSYWADLVESIHRTLANFWEGFLRNKSATGWETRDDDCYMIYSVALVNLMMSFKTRFDYEGSVRSLKDVISRIPYQNDLWSLSKNLYKLYSTVYAIRSLREKGLKALRLSCKALWKWLEIHKAYPGSASSNNSPAVFILDVATQQTKELLNKHDWEDQKIDKLIMKYLKQWSDFENLVEKLPAPVSIIELWVKRNCLLGTRDVHRFHHEISIDVEFSYRAKEKLLEQELLEYKRLSYENPKLCHEVRLEIMYLLCNLYDVEQKSLEKAKILIARARELRVVEKLNESSSLSEAIFILQKLKKTGFSSEVPYLLVCTCILHLLSILESKEKVLFQRGLQSKIEDSLRHIQVAVGECPGLIDHSHLDEALKMLLKDVQNLFCLAIDLLLLKGYSSLILYDIMIRLHKTTPLNKMLSWFWKNKRVSHALCISPIEDSCLISFSNQPYDPDHFWRVSMTAIEPLVGDFDCTSDMFEGHINDLISKVPESKSKGKNFLLSHLYFEMCERLMHNGRMIEALSYAKSAKTLREELMKTKFQTLKVDEHRQTKGNNFICTLRLNSLVREKDHLGDCISSDFEDIILTPWNICRCYLESLLQVATVLETLGHDMLLATDLLNFGKTFCKDLGSPLCEILFSSMLGKIYSKEESYEEAEVELNYAKETIEKYASNIPCSKCLNALRVTIHQELGHLILRQKGDLFHANIDYFTALDKLNLLATSNLQGTSDLPGTLDTNQKVQEEIVTNIFRLCNNTRCWSCLQLEARESRSFYKFVQLRFELVFKKLSLRLLIDIGKYLVACQHIEQGVKALFGLCSKHSADLSLDSIGSDFPGDVLVAERAALLYFICWFKFKSNSISNLDTSDGSKMSESLAQLKLAYILSCEIPLLNEKVCRLLAVLYAQPIETLRVFLPPNEVLSADHLASFFHQASTGAHINLKLLSDMMDREKEKSDRSQYYLKVSPRKLHSRMVKKLNLLRLLPESITDMAKSVESFFEGLPNVPIMCISFIDDADADLFRNLLGSTTKMWILVSLLKFGSRHCTIFLAVDKRLNGDISSDASIVASVFNQILLEDKTAREMKDRRQKIEKRKELDARLSKFLQDMQDAWLDPLKRLLLEVWPNSHKVDKVNSQSPIILVLDLNSQRLPWEYLPMLITGEVYRMLSVGSICARYDPSFLFNPNKLFYLTDPLSDLNLKNDDFHLWMKDKFKGYVQQRPRTKDFVKDLEKYDLFVYRGHDDGLHYFSTTKIENINNCGVVLLLGCHSCEQEGAGRYLRTGAPITYLLAGSQAVVGTLWTVTSGEIDDFGEKLVQFWIRESKSKCDRCRTDNYGHSCNHRLMKKTAMETALNACELPYLTGASLVCYGVPTNIMKRCR